MLIRATLPVPWCISLYILHYQDIISYTVVWRELRNLSVLLLLLHNMIKGRYSLKTTWV